MLEEGKGHRSPIAVALARVEWEEDRSSGQLPVIVWFIIRQLYFVFVPFLAQLPKPLEFPER